MLGEIGKGHVIAFNILNIGRLKLCAAALGGTKSTVDVTVQYANTREQFKQPIANFGAIQHKLAEIAIRIWIGEEHYTELRCGLRKRKKNCWPKVAIQ